MTDGIRIEVFKVYALRWRGVRTACVTCNGSGGRWYGSGATWRGGAGTATPEHDVCDSCWGSGDAERPWMDLRKHLAEVDMHIAERAVDLLARSVGATMHNTHPAIAVIVDMLDKLANRRGAPAAAHLPELARGLANTLRRAIGVSKKDDAP